MSAWSDLSEEWSIVKYKYLPKKKERHILSEEGYIISLSLSLILASSSDINYCGVITLAARPRRR